MRRTHITHLAALVALLAPAIASPATLITDPNAVFSVPNVVKPTYAVPFTDPTFTTTITRIAGEPGTTFNFSDGGTGIWGTDVRQHYQSDQPWNYDGSLLLLQNKETNASPSQILLDGNTYQPKYEKCSNYDNSDDRWVWSPNHVNERMNVRGTLLEWFDVVNCQQTRVWTLPFAHANDYEMGPSRDGRFIALGDATRAFVVDMDPRPPFASYASDNKRIGPAADISSCGLSSCTVDSINISPSGRYVLVRYQGDYQRVFDVDPDTLALTPHSYPSTTPECSDRDPSNGYIFDLGHGDMTFNPYDDNEEVTVGQRRSWCPSSVNGVSQGEIETIRLRDGAVTTLTVPENEAHSYHVSARAYNRSGWVYASYWPVSGAHFNDEIMAVKMDGSHTVERFAHDHTDTANCYRCESHPVPSPDGMRILFASSWTSNCGALCGSQSNPQGYVIDTRPLRGTTTAPPPPPPTP
jgi:hypothetical protein